MLQGETRTPAVALRNSHVAPTVPRKSPGRRLGLLDSLTSVTPEAFCAAMRRELAAARGDEAWVRGAEGLCEMYARATPERFEVILEQAARGAPGSAFADGARWLLPRWRGTQGSRQ